ncbi:MAG: cell filamentation protein Fic, partial [bacterium]
MSGSFVPGYLESQPVSPLLVRTIRRLGELNARREFLVREQPELVARLKREAMIRSVESSNRIEGVVTTAERITGIVEGTEAPVTRNEREIVGYRDVLGTVL